MAEMPTVIGRNALELTGAVYDKESLFGENLPDIGAVLVVPSFTRGERHSRNWMILRPQSRILRGKSTPVHIRAAHATKEWGNAVRPALSPETLGERSNRFDPLTCVKFQRRERVPITARASVVGAQTDAEAEL
jgi:hypothetical protein